MNNEKLNRTTLLSVCNGTARLPITTAAELRVEFLKKLVDNGIGITLNSYFIHYTT